MQIANHEEVAKQAGLSKELAKGAFYYLQSQGLVQAHDPVGSIKITYQGIKEYETGIIPFKTQPNYLNGQRITSTRYTSMVEESVILFGSYAMPIPLGAGSENVTPAKRNKLSSVTEQTSETQIEEEKPKKHFLNAAMEYLKGAMTHPLFKTIVRFFLSKLRRFRW